MVGLSFSSKFDWSSYIISIAKTASKKIGALICSMKFLFPEVTLYLCKSTIQPYMEHRCHDWAGVLSSYFEILDKLQKRICRTVNPSVAITLKPLSHQQNVANLSLFCRYYFDRCSSELAWLVLFSHSRRMSTLSSDRFHAFFFLTISRSYGKGYINTFFPTQLDSWILCHRMLFYNLNAFKPRFNRHLLTVGTF